MERKESTSEEVLEGFSNFLRERGLARINHIPYLVRWVKEFLGFARKLRGYTFEQAKGLFMEALERR